MVFGRRTAAALALLVGGVSAAPNEIELAFKDFVAKYGRAYHSEEETAERFGIFESTYKFIQSENAKKASYFLVINEFADQAPEEFKSTHFGLSAPPSGKLWAGVPSLGMDLYSGADLPADIDWVTKGAVTSPKNQGGCGSCWSFSTIGALEGAWAAQGQTLVSLSEQQLVDCSTGNSGCSGGDMDAAFKYLMGEKTCTESSYPYLAKASTCGSLQSSCDVGIPKGAIKGYFDVPVDDTNALMEAVAQQPVSVAIEADQLAFQTYGGGVLSKTCGSKLDHGVLLVGYGTDAGVDYWKVKNSWGATWGESGYVRLERGLPKDGQCGIKAHASYPKVTASDSTPVEVPPTPVATQCVDNMDYCTNKKHFNPAQDCALLAKECKKTCSCCVAVQDQPEWCNRVSEATVVV